MSNSAHWDGEAYRQISLPQFNINQAFLDEQEFRGNEKILDIGCGDGTTTQAIAKHIPRGHILGIDASASMIASANKTNPSTNVDFIICDAQKIEFHAEFDRITCFFCMQWVENKGETFKHIYRSLKPSGDFLMIVPLPHPHLPKLRNELIVTRQWQSYFKRFADPLIHINDNNYCNYAKIAGLTVKTNRIDLTPIQFKNYEDFFQFMRQMTPHLSALPTSTLQDQFLHELLTQYNQVVLPKNGQYRLDFSLVKFRALRENAL